MEHIEATLAPAKSKRFLLYLGVIFVAANLRAPLTSVGPVISEISQALSLSNTAAGLITTIPLMAFGFLSGLMPRLSKRFGLELVLFFSLLLLGLGLIMRSYGGLITLFLGSILVGTAITVGNVLMPPYIKKYFPDNVGSVTGLYTVGMNLTAALAAGYSVSLGQFTHWGWQASIGIWVLITFVTVLIWLPQIGKKNTQNTAEKITDDAPKVVLYKSKLAWAVTIFMGLQSLLFYCLAAWLPKALQTWGISVEDSGWALSYIQFAQLPSSFIGAIIATKMKDQRPLTIAVGLLFGIGIFGLYIFQVHYILLWCVLIGIGSGLAFSLSMLFFVLRTQHTAHASKLSGMAQSFGYLIAACGPPLFGAFYDLSLTWDWSFIFLLIMTAILFISGLIAGKNRFI